VWDVYSGVVKSLFFGVAIALIACQQGLATTGGAKGVGRRTTSAVVTTFFVLVVIDAGFTVLFHSIPPMSTEPMIRVIDLTMGWDDVVLQKNANFDVTRGEIFAILGSSGCGKSTLMRYLVGLDAPLVVP